MVLTFLLAKYIWSQLQFSNVSGVFFIFRNVPQGRDMTCDVELVVTQPGRRQLFATFYSNEINDVKGILDIYMQ